ncbi:hypothetical protein BC832DRAFT_202277 [Gaertneriomyces semiglobifer]|nr:hypothetical protein BC832DRAFT_202277 [Gaertneriomyces semiglobifer]
MRNDPISTLGKATSLVLFLYFVHCVLGIISRIHVERMVASAIAGLLQKGQIDSVNTPARNSDDYVMPNPRLGQDGR